MIHSYADNALMSKVRALYGKRLTTADYEQLLTRKNLVEVAAYLQSETYYAENLQEVKAESVHRGQLENLIRRRTLNTYTKLLKYAHHETLFLRLYVMRSEIEQLLIVIRLLNSGCIDRYIVELPVHLAKLMSFDLFAVANIEDFDDLLGVLQHSDYFRIVSRFRPSGIHNIIDITSCEAALLTYYYQTAAGIVRREYHGETREDLERLLRQQLSVHNASVIYRMRRHLKADREMIQPRVVRVEGWNGRFFDQLLNAEDVAAMQQLLSQQRALLKTGFHWDLDSSQLATKMLAVRGALTHKLFRFSTKPVVVVICYMALLEIEQSNIVHIVEGIRYGMPPDEIRLLICE